MQSVRKTFLLKFLLALMVLGLGLAIVLPRLVKADGAPISTTSIVLAVSPVVSNGVAYTANDAVGGLMIFSGAVGRKMTALIANVLVVDKSKQNAILDIVCWNQSITATADNAAWAISDADNLKAVAAISIPAAAYIDVGSSSIAVISGISELVFSNSGRDIYCQMATRGTPTYTSTSDLQITLTFLQD